MARQARYTIPGIPQHVIQRGNNRKPCFFEENDYFRYWQYLKEAANTNDAIVHAYVFMTNHVHLLVTPQHEHSISFMMQDLGRKYVRYVNKTQNRTGTLWEGRYKSGLVDSEAYLYKCMRYIELNPVRACMVDHPAEYRWSSYACNALGKPDTLVQPHALYTELGEENEQRQSAYRELFCEHLEADQIADIRNSLNQQLVLGCDEFKDRIEKIRNLHARPRPLGRPRIKEAEAEYY